MFRGLKCIRSLIDIGIMDGVSLYDNLTDSPFLNYSEKKSKESDNFITLNRL